MTDETPSPTTRMPVPEKPVDAPTEGWPGTTATTGADLPDPATALPAPPTIPPPPPPAVATRRRRDDADPGRRASVLFGAIILAVGLWFLAEHTFGLELPSIRWNQVWPVILIVIGLWVVLGSMRRGPR